ncbi:MAG: protein kinase [Myxococcota bacterium]|nr:protein kinase [Myxococcota bacterium]
MATASARLDAEIKVARGAVRERASTLSKLLAVRAAVVTDVSTAQSSLESGELEFSPGPGEVIELGQIKDGKAITFLVQPVGATMPSRDGKPGSYAELMDDRLAITEVAEVVPSSDAVIDGVRVTGYVMVSRPLDLAPSIAALEAANLSGRFEVTGPAGTKTRPIGTPIGDVPTETRPLPSEPGAQLIVAVPPVHAATPMPLVGIGAGAAVLGLLVLAFGLLRGTASAGPTPLATPATEPVSGGAATQLSAQFPAVGTPPGVDPMGATGIHPSNLGPGAMIGRWELLRRLGSGGMADVFLAHSKGEAGFEKLVAIKVMHSHLARNTRAVEHFLDEARLAARIHHPNVVGIQDLGKIGEDYVIVMDYVEGVDLERLLASARDTERAVPLDIGLAILCRICDGLNAAHRATSPDGTPLNMIHRDVKSANVLVSRQGGVKVVDFGIAKAATQVHHTVAGETKGTPSMMAPEQRIGEQVDIRADVYSLAAVAFEVLTGRAVNLDLATLAHLGIENWPHLPPPSTLRADLPPELDGILLTAMAYDRERRPADCLVFEETLEGVMKRHGMAVSDKDIARWVEGELKLMVPPFQGTSALLGRPASAS